MPNNEQRQRSRGWCWTLNNHTEEEIANLLSLLDDSDTRYDTGGTPGTPLSLVLINLITDMHFKKRPVKEAPPTFKGRSTSRTPSPSPKSNNGTCDCMLKEHVTFTGPSNIVQILKNAAGVSGPPGSPYSKTTSTSYSKKIYTTGKENWSPSWGDYPIDEE